MDDVLFPQVSHTFEDVVNHVLGVDRLNLADLTIEDGSSLQKLQHEVH